MRLQLSWNSLRSLVSFSSTRWVDSAAQPAGEFRSIVHHDHLGRAPLVHDRVDLADDPFGRQGLIHHDERRLARAVIDEIEGPKRAPVGQAVPRHTLQRVHAPVSKLDL